ncbi:metal-dependent hydrolase [Haloferax gibbonsii]|uniref:metal-dependent hydrolase n=1 Tax=Haloferax gibbonsii TaxID=35746 RepID=UPI0009E51D3E|nr:metal-dependent hydrolase [Haloferax gibbonsii]
MPDLLAHTLLAYTIATVLSWRIGWLSRSHVTVVMAGAFIPDLAKVELLIPSQQVESLFGVPFDWFGLHTTGGVLCSVLIGVLLVSEAERRRVFGLLALGASSHLVADALLLKPSGLSYPILWPMMRVYPPTPGLYLSTDVWPAVTLGVLAFGVGIANRWIVGERRDATD